MKKFLFLGYLFLLSIAGLSAQTAETGEKPFEAKKFKPRYAGTSLDAGVMFTSGMGPAYYIVPKISFQTTPRLFLNAGVGMMQYGMTPRQSGLEYPFNRSTAVSTFVFAEGLYFLNEKWSINGSVMKEVGSGPLREVSPYCVPKEAMHLGVQYNITPNISVGARIGYSNGRSRSFYGPFAPF
jgi:hypothetical protein